MTKDKIKVLIVDDSLFMRAAIKKTLDKDGRFEIIGQAKDGKDGVDKVESLSPDVVTMDFNMPVMNGAQAVREIMKSKPTPVIMFSAHTKQGARETFEALAAGAIDFVTKPSGEVSANLAEIEADLIGKLTAAVGSRPRAVKPVVSRKPPDGSVLSTWPPGGPRVVFVAVSTGGPAALSRVIPALPADIPFGVVIVQHMPAQFTSTLAERLDSISAVKVREAKDGDTPRQGVVLIAPGDRHLEVGERGKLTLTSGPLVNGCRPSADVTMASAAKVFGRRAIGLVMTGMGRDGTAGLKAIKAAHGPTVAQDKATSVIFGMPKAAIDAGVVDKVVALDAIAQTLTSL